LTKTRSPSGFSFFIKDWWENGECKRDEKELTIYRGHNKVILWRVFLLHCSIGEKQRWRQHVCWRKPLLDSSRLMICLMSTHISTAVATATNLPLYETWLSMCSWFRWCRKVL
jgi:hypothetical protein